MRLTYFFNSEAEAEAFFLKVVPLYTGETNAISVETEEHELTPDELYESCHMCSWYKDDQGIYAFLDFDEELMSISDRIMTLIEKIVAPTGVNYTGCTRIDQKVHWPCLQWPEVPPRLLNQNLTHTYHLHALLPSHEQEAKSLSEQQQVMLLQHWLQYGNLALEDLEMAVFSDNADGSYRPNTLEEIIRAIYGNDLNHCSYIWVNNPNKRLALTEISAANVISSNSSAMLYILSDNKGVELSIHTSALTTEEQYLLIERYQSSPLYQFIRNAFVHLFQTEPCLVVKENSEKLEVEDAANTLLTISEALKIGSYKVSAIKANQALLELGILKEMKVRKVKATKKAFNDDESPFGENLIKSDRKNDIEARYYLETFRALMHKLGHAPKFK